MFDLLDKLFEVVATKVDPEKQMRDHYRKVLNTKLKKSTYVEEKDWLKFWLLTNGDVVPVRYTHDDTAGDADVPYPVLLSAGAISGAVMDTELSLSGGPKKITAKQIQKLKSIYIEYKIESLFYNTSISDPFSMKVKNAKELAYYLEYGKEKWESKNTDEAVAVRAEPEKQMRDHYKKILNTRITKGISGIERHYLKFWLLTNGDVIPVTNTHADTAKIGGPGYVELRTAGAVIAAILDDELTLDCKEKFTQKQISKLKSIYIEYKIKSLVVDSNRYYKYFSVDVKSPNELAYYLKYGKEEFESMNAGDLLDKILEATASDIRRKHRSIKRLFPDFDAKTKGVEDKGGLKLVDQDNKTWKFKIHSGTQKSLWYDAYLSFKDPKQTLERMVKDRSFWVADKTRVDLRKLAKAFMNKADIQLFCSCPADLYWGGQYIRSLDKYDAKYAGKEVRPPSVRNPKKYGMVCKHLDRLLKVLPFYGSTLAKWIKDFYAEDIAKWEKESQEEFLGGVRKAQAAVAKRREEPEVEEPVEEPEPVTKAMDKAIAKKEEPEEKPEEEKPEEEPKKEEPEEPEKEEPEEEKPEEEEPKKKKSKTVPKKPRREKPPQAEWKPDAGEGPEEDYF